MDRTIVLHKDKQGNVYGVGKLIGDKEFVFGYINGKNGELKLIGKYHYGGNRQYEDFFLPKEQYRNARRQAAAVFRGLRPPKYRQLTFSFY